MLSYVLDLIFLDTSLECPLLCIVESFDDLTRKELYNIKTGLVHEKDNALYISDANICVG